MSDGMSGLDALSPHGSRPMETNHHANEWRLELLGTPRLLHAGRVVPVALRRAWLLLAYLAVAEQPQPREHLAELLWPEAPPGVGRTRLRRLLHRLRNVPLVSARESLALDPRVETDIDRFTAAIRAAGAQVEPEVARATLEHVGALYRGDFLHATELSDCEDGEDWRRAQASRFRGMQVLALRRLAALQRDAGDIEAALASARALLALDRSEETSHALLIELYLAAGSPGAARAQLADCEQALRQELGVAPSESTRSLVAAHRDASAPPPVSRFTVSGDAHVAYQVLGDGPTDILLIPGFVSHIEQFWLEPALAEFLAGLASMGRLIHFDRRGIGLSDRGGGPPTPESTAQDIRAVLDACGSRRAVLFGVSEGGPSAVRFVAAEPARAAGLILFGSMARGCRAPDYPWALDEGQLQRWTDRLVESWGGPTSLESFAPSVAADPQVRDWWARTLRLGSSPAAVRAVIEALGQTDVRDCLPQIRVPTLIMHRERDPAVSVGAGRHLSKGIEDARWLPLAGEDHWPWFGDSAAVLNAIADHLEAVRGNGRQHPA
jgi:DNA-binding SARP family transcriptional activator/pimeloyl-ACP methyl ester carboxylesterase